ncbi:MAG: DNA topoisomerase I [Omnitrophica bacterium GWA2_41_15]|nr:MAG: DNA topoisomerase I [Omnitrophica bacterium GWA2_41_15]HAZ10272.1 type I DNA topoisomerase [Candidatus Omnitrophota bacterium]
MAKSLVIVESPAKASTINKILGKNFIVTSSMGHIMDLPKSKMGIDIEKDFTPEYIMIPGKKKIVDVLKKEAADVDSIFLATDPDREGEAISWHLANLLGKKKKIYRIAFHEITRTAIEAAIGNPGKIDMNMVDAQQTRRTLDRLVGYSISPLLWRKVGRGLSAGRVQSVAVRLIVDRENEIHVFVPEEYWDIEAELKKKDVKNSKFIAKLDKIEDKKIDLKNQSNSMSLVAELEKEKFIVEKVEKKEKRKYAQPPFITSKLQQEAFYKLRFQAVKTMKVAQQLYEGLPIGSEGNVGLITYMRTDAVKVSKESQDFAKSYILEKYGPEFAPNTSNVYKSKKSAQEAHEAIRPALPLREPSSIQEFLTIDQYKLYTLIWNRFISSQMTPAVFNVVSVGIRAGRCIFKANGSQKVFQGFSVVYEENEEEKEEEKILPSLEAGEILDLLKLDPSQHFTKPPPRYSDASLVKALEEDGIGRPSTYAPIIQTIIARNYVKRKEGYFCPSDLGIVVTDLLIKSFPKILDMEFTAKMEEELDEIEEGRQKSVEVLKRFYAPFEKEVEHAKVNMRKVKGEAVKTSDICETCGKPMVIKWGRLGRFLSCSDFPNCRFAKAISTGVKCPESDCGGMLVERRSKGGRHFYGCSKYPNCHHISRRLPSQDGEDSAALEGEDA